MYSLSSIDVECSFMMCCSVANEVTVTGLHETYSTSYNFSLSCVCVSKSDMETLLAYVECCCPITSIPLVGLRTLKTVISCDSLLIAGSILLHKCFIPVTALVK